MRFQLLHLSDLHFGKCHCHWADPNSAALDMLGDLMGALDQASIKPDFDAIVITGDFTWDPQKDGFGCASKFVQGLRQQSGLEAGPVLLVPGNHDIFWGEKEDEGYRYRTRGEAESLYKKFRDECTGPPCTIVENACIFCDRDKKVILVGLDSCKIIEPVTSEIGWVGCDQVIRLARALREGVGAREWDNYCKVAILHHHPVGIIDQPLSAYAEPGAKWSVSYLARGEEILDLLRCFGFALVLHGHEHRFTSRVLNDNPPAFGCASLGLYQQLCEGPHGFQVLELQGNGLTLHKIEAAKWAEAQNEKHVWTRSTETLKLSTRQTTLSDAQKTRHDGLIERDETARRSFLDRGLWIHVFRDRPRAINYIRDRIKNNWGSKTATWGEFSEDKFKTVLAQLKKRGEKGVFEELGPPKNQLLEALFLKEWERINKTEA